MDSTAIKQEILEKCLEIHEQRIAHAQQAMESAQASANAEERSTAGDKHDTSRAMSHITRELNAEQLNELLETKKDLLQLNIQDEQTIIRKGAIVKTSHGNFFIAIHVGPVEFEGDTYFVISPKAPIAKVLLGKSVGESFDFNKQNFTINEVF
ncbi:GreA/GreB family elongation factor [Sediminitomix flava]|uniref:GreA/GreB family transcription elongation factor n=1 Tax=Sediminitomix flava TaxID=379075 RepID=A0A315ZD33_SEDFL|nr:GreA/GreB family elongation factor [Sediminitomix flava]PWJ43029.1 GreA/GreB family transcription elongation factor [Sediminitomix flava]